jgi:hypothetical protein
MMREATCWSFVSNATAAGDPLDPSGFLLRPSELLFDRRHNAEHQKTLVEYKTKLKDDGDDTAGGS